MNFKRTPSIKTLWQEKKWLGVLWTIISLIFLAVFIYFSMQPSTGEPVRKELEKEFKAIAPLPHAISQDYQSTFKDQHALVEGYYLSTASYQQIRQYYVDELAKHGWQFKQESELRDLGRGLGKTMIFCKGTFNAEIEYFGMDRQPNDWAYAFGLSWGLRPDLCRKQS
ncbi:hypothetical protein [Aquirhabdus parva]|nr:hypothetical protein [Aquirhabdus parva]